jgi:tetratricopeptide (TPR) repeat protein
MALKTFSTAPRRHQRFIIVLFCGLLLFGCMPQTKVSVTDKQTPPAPLPTEKSSVPPTVKPDGAQVLAAEALVDQGRQLLAQGAPDAAIRVLERSVALDSNSGQNYYYLAEAWLMKQNAHQAREFNRLAEIYLGRDPDWKNRIGRQSDRINNLGH